MKYVTADMLREAADTRLWTGEVDTGGNYASCITVHAAGGSDAYYEMCNLIREMGEPSLMTCFDEFDDDFERQGARFLWLDFLARVVEDGAL